ncbi:hypothetical protein FCM35_KLT01043 [Carex littledalei]|uniref:Uncharacterized protein n=1 Tax=Carex littledalei TaxID=544730 RepID=A0A833R8H5_9POAL|nr:hypothetical protein FCM35_KLT01043 [Carex littledalei]
MFAQEVFQLWHTRNAQLIFCFIASGHTSKIIVAPFAIGAGAFRNVNRGFVIPELPACLSFSAVFLVVAVGTLSEKTTAEHVAGSNVVPLLQRQVIVPDTADNIMEPPWVAAHIMRKMDYPYEEVQESMKDPKVAEFWLNILPQIVGCFKYGENVKKKNSGGPTKNKCHMIMQGEREPSWDHLEDRLLLADKTYHSS